MPNCEAQIFISGQLLKNATFYIFIWHYKMPVSNHVIQLQIMISAVIVGPVCGA